jgi:hypothetical protein
MTTDPAAEALASEDWGKFACDVIVSGSVVARFRYSDSAGQWAKENYSGKFELRDLPSQAPAPCICGALLR